MECLIKIAIEVMKIMMKTALNNHKIKHYLQKIRTLIDEIK